ncbi:MAG: hypothetical protein ACPGSD_08040 [Flavobacteriales bacterium]
MKTIDTDIEKLFECLKLCKPYFSDTWKLKYNAFLSEEHLFRLAKIGWPYLKNENITFTLPSQFITQIQFTEQYIQKLKEGFESIVNRKTTDYKSSELITLAAQIEDINIEDLLILSGQRLSSTSWNTIEALPPNYETLLKACLKPFNKHLSIGVKQWEKHEGRPGDTFWPTRTGNSAEKEEKVKGLIEHLFEHLEWWNTYFHYQHEMVFEIRTKTGHGMRWKLEDFSFIGFLEPFIDFEYKPDSIKKV